MIGVAKGVPIYSSEKIRRYPAEQRRELYLLSYYLCEVDHANLSHMDLAPLDSTIVLCGVLALPDTALSYSDVLVKSAK